MAAVGACSERPPDFPTAEDRRKPPYGPGAEVGKAYDDYVLYTHCGITHAEIDGTYWEADPALAEGGNPPRGWGNPLARGTMELLTPDRAAFESDEHVAFFRRADGTPPPCD